jgi:hypothetical protein
MKSSLFMLCRRPSSLDVVLAAIDLLLGGGVREDENLSS